MGLCEANDFFNEGSSDREGPVVDGGLKRAEALLRARKALVVGLGATGRSVARFLARCGAEVTATDLRTESDLSGAEELKALGVGIEAGGHNVDSFKGAELVVVSPGMPFKSPLLAAADVAGAEVISEIELASRFIDCPIIAVAGTNGKSTVTELLGRIFEEAGLKAFVGGNLGTPAIEYVASGGQADLCVLEVSSFQLETVKGFCPRIGILLNITEDHLDRYDDFEEYAETKFRLFARQTGKDYAVINAADPVIAKRRRIGLANSTVVPFTVAGTLKEGLFLDGPDIVYIPGAGLPPERYPTGKIALKGLHNMENCMAAIAASRLSGASKEAVNRALAGFNGLSHRMELVRELDGVMYIDDSKGTNVGALKMALKGMGSPVVLIAGGRDKGGEYGVLTEVVGEKVKSLILIGEAGPAIREALGPYVDTAMAATLEEAVRKARAVAVAGDTVLLSPACSSFDMFSSYKERGDRFKEIVRGL